jgi:hypothetical protein
MSKKLKLIFGIAAGAVFFALAAWFWSLGAIASEDVPAIRVEARQPGVEIRRQGSQDWRKVENGADLQPGDSVRTDAEGLAEIRWGDLGVTRLDASGEIAVETLPPDISDATKASIKLRLAAGRVWSRLMKLYGPEASFEVRTDSVVVTVRGTAFGLAKDSSSTRVAVTEAVVEVQPVAGGASTWIKQGKGAEFDGLGSTSGVRDLSDEDSWVNGNKRLDEEFDKAFRAELEERFKQRQVAAPEWLVEMSEGWHLKMASGEKRGELATAYATRRIAALALGRNIGCLNGNAVCAKVADIAMQGNVGRLLSQLRSALLVAPGISQSDTPFGWLRNLKNRLLDSCGVAGKKYANILGVWEKDPGRAISDQNLRNYLLDITREIDGDVARASGLDEKMREVLDKDVEGLFVMLREDGEGGSTSSSTVSTAATPTSTAPVSGQPARRPAPDGGKSSEVNPAPQPVVQPPTDGACSYTNLTLMTKPTSGIEIGAPVSLTLLGTCPDGRFDDLTPKATFNPGATGDGRVVGNIFYPARGGDILLYGNFFSDGKTRIAQAVISVNQGLGRRPVSLKVTPLGPTTIATGQSSAIQAIATYDDKATMDVTSRCVWSSSNPRLADVFSGRVEVINGTGEVTITCTFSDNGVSVSDSQLYTVILDPSLTPSSGGTAGRVLYYRPN